MITPDELEILHKPEVQEYIRECQGDPKGYDQFHCLTCGAYFQQRDSDCNCNEYESEKWIRIPDCISRDSERPERGMVGMLDDSWEIINPYLSDKWMVRCLAEQMDQGPDALTYTQNISFSGTPRLALLKALEWQIEGRKG